MDYHSSPQEYDATKDRPSAVTDIYAEVNRLSNVIDRAEQNLVHVLSPEFGAIDNSPPAPALVRSLVRETHQDLSNQIERLIRLLDRVEV